MAVVRELITVLGASVDQAGFKQYETGIARIKSLAADLGKMFGLVFTADKLIEFADGLVDAGKEVNKITAQLKLILRPMDDINETTQGVYDLSQRLGVSYVHMLDTYKEFANEVRDTKIPTQELLSAVENIQKGFEVARATPEQQSQVMEALQRGFRSGKMRPVSVGLMKDILPPEAFNMLLREFNLGVGDAGEAALREMAKKGEISAERVISAFSKASGALDAQFDAVPKKIGRVFTKIYNDLVVVTAAIYKLTDASVFMGQIVWYVWTRFRNAVVAVTEVVGGLKNLIQLLGIALAVAIGPMLIRNLTMAVALTLRWAFANALLLVQWLAIAAAVAAVAIAIQDLVFWIQGKDSLIGSWVGPFKDLAENFKKLDIFAGFRGIGDLLKGDFAGFKKEWDIFVKDTPAEIALLVASIATIGTGFWLLVPAIKGVLEAIKLLRPEAVKVGEGIAEGVAKSKGSVPEVIRKETSGGTAATPGGNPMAGVGPRIGMQGATLGLNFWNILGLIGEERRRAEAGLPEQKKPLDALMDTKPGKAYSDFYNKYMPKIDTSGIIEGVTSGLLRFWNGPEAIRNENANRMQPTVTPGALGPAQAGPRTDIQNIQPTLNQTNNIKVETMLDAAQIGSIVSDKVKSAGEQFFNGFTRDLQRAGPRVEAPVQ